MVDPTDFESAVVDAIDVLAAASTRHPRKRTGERAPISTQVRLLVLLRDGFRCDWCGVSGREQLFHLDHIVPWSAGGGDSSANLRLLCPECNERRSNYRTDTGYVRRLTCVPACMPCMHPAAERHIFDDSDIQQVFCGACRQRSWITNDPSWGCIPV